MSDASNLMAREAMALWRAGRLSEAEATYERLVELWPNLPESWFNLGVLQRKAGRFEAALASYQQALNRGVTQPEEAHLNRGVIYSDALRQDEAADRELRAALALNPNYVPALLNLGNLNEDRGRRDEALGLYERILVLDPHYHEALARAANLTTVSSPDDPMIGRLREAISRRDTPPADKASLGFVLGKSLDAAGDFDAAFAAYVQANQHSRDSAAPRRALYDRQAHERYVDQLIATFTPAWRETAAPVTGPPPIFICGMFRSGSTLTEQVLAAHPRVTAGGELDLLPAYVRSDLSPFPAAMARIGPAQLEPIARRYRDTLSTLFPGADLVTDKRPENFLHIGLIKSLFPNAKIINTTRDPLDTCLSIFFLHLDQGLGYALDLMDTAHYYRQYRRLMAHWKTLFGDDILDFDYDGFVREPRPALEALLGFCDLDWDDNCLAFHRVDNAVKTASVWQVREPLYQRSSGRWRRYERHLGPLSAYLAQP